MALQATVVKRVFNFSFSARTSRGPMRDRRSWFVKIKDTERSGVFGLGECAPLPGLSVEFNEDFETTLAAAIEHFNAAGVDGGSLQPQNDHFFEIERVLHDVFVDSRWEEHAALRFALETALLDLLGGGRRILFEQPFTKSQPIPINGLIWMGGMDFMLQQVELKIQQGFKCIKLKVGGINFERECDILQYTRRKYFREDIEIRLDANGAFKPDDALPKLSQLAEFNIHSIEQPLKKGSEMLAEVCAKSPIPVALDEELIGLPKVERIHLLEKVKPAYIILKPSLHGGLCATRDWITLAEKQNIGWWITSALESNVGLNAIAQFASLYQLKLPQGLGTGQIYDNNFSSPLDVENGFLHYRPSGAWNLEELADA